MSDDLMRINEVAQYLGVTDITVKRYIREKLLTAIEKNGQTLLEKGVVERYKLIADRFNKR